MQCGKKLCNNMLNDKIKYFKSQSICEIVTIPKMKPDMERILKALVCPCIVNVKIIDTKKGLSNEGQRLTGIKLIVEVNLKQKIIYVANEKTQKVHNANFETLKSMFVVLPEKINGQSVYELFDENKIKIIPCIETIYVRMIDKRTIQKCVLLFLKVKICE